MEDVAGSRGGVADFGTEASEGKSEFGQAQNRDGVAGSNVVDAGHGRMKGGEMKDVGGAGTGLGERGGIENGATEKSTVEVGQIFFFSGGEVVKNGDRAAGGEAADEVAADKAGAAGDEGFHR